MSRIVEKMNKRLQKEYKSVRSDMADGQVGIGAEPMDGDMCHWRALIEGPADTPFADGFFELVIAFPQNYPFAAPSVKFTHAVYHPNVYTSNDICLDILSDQWSPSYRINGVLKSIRSLLNDPNINSPANIDASKAYGAWTRDKTDTRYEQNVRETMQKVGRYNAPLPKWYIEAREQAMRAREERKTAKKRKVVE